jgi:hypothetical protein
MLGKGRAEAISNRDMERLALELGCHPATLEAIADVESAGFGWFRDGRIKILFEKHWFYKLLNAANRSVAVRMGLARRKWISPSKGGYKDQKTPDQRYELLADAMEIDETAALQSISMGRFQIMGFNYKTCGFDSPQAMWEDFLDSEVKQLEAFARFLEAKKLGPALKRNDFDLVEKRYNGGGLKGAYARKMEAAYVKLSNGKWKGWNREEASIHHETVIPRAKPKAGVNPKPLTSSRTVGGSGVAAGGGIALLVEPVQDAIAVIEGQKEALTSGQWFAMAMGALTIFGALVALYARWDDAGRPVPWED